MFPGFFVCLMSLHWYLHIWWSNYLFQFYGVAFLGRTFFFYVFYTVSWIGCFGFVSAWAQQCSLRMISLAITNISGVWKCMSGLDYEHLWRQQCGFSGGRNCQVSQFSSPGSGRVSHATYGGSASLRGSTSGGRCQISWSLVPTPWGELCIWHLHQSRDQSCWQWWVQIS